MDKPPFVTTPLLSGVRHGFLGRQGGPFAIECGFLQSRIDASEQIALFDSASFTYVEIYNRSRAQYFSL